MWTRLIFLYKIAMLNTSKQTNLSKEGWPKYNFSILFSLNIHNNECLNIKYKMNAALAVAYLHLIAFLSNAMLFLQYKYSRSAMDAFIASTPTK